MLHIHTRETSDTRRINQATKDFYQKGEEALPGPMARTFFDPSPSPPLIDIVCFGPLRIAVSLTILICVY